MALIGTYDARLLRPETTVGAGAQTLLLALLATVVGLGPAGWLTGLAFTLGTWAVLTRALRRRWPRECLQSSVVRPKGRADGTLNTRPRPFGPANGVTLARTTLVGGVTALIADSFLSRPPVAVMVGLAAVALILDAVDGQVARRTGTESALGARFDMEVDAFLILVLSVYVAMSLGAWVLLIGAMRYAFVVAARVLPWLHGPLPPSTARKTVAALQGIVLLVVGAGIVPRLPAYAAVLAALALLVWSFARDIRWLWRVRVRDSAVVVRDPSHERA